MASPLDTHWKAVKCILCYLAGTTDFGLHIRRSNNMVSAFCDSDWADLDDRKSVTGYCTFLGSNLISWCSKKQSIISRSSTEAEYRSLTLTASEVTWIMSLLSEINMLPPKPPTIWVDNLSTISFASNPVLHARTKHIELDVHFIRDRVLAKQLDLRHVPSVDQVADILTKPLSLQFFARLRNKLGICSLSTLELRGRDRVKIKEEKTNMQRGDVA